MNRDFKTRVDRDDRLESLAAELALAAYRAALQTRTRGTWLDLELDLRGAMAQTGERWGRYVSSHSLPSVICRYEMDSEQDSC